MNYDCMIDLYIKWFVLFYLFNSRKKVDILVQFLEYQIPKAKETPCVYLFL